MRLTALYAAAAVAAVAAVPAAPVLAHGGGDSVGEAWRWTWEPVTTAALALSVLGYGVGVARVWRQAGRGRGVRGWEVASFAAGWLALVAVLLSPLHALGRVLFALHMTQHEILMMVAAPLLVLGRPLTAWTWSLPLRWRRGFGARARPPLFRRTWRIVGSALFAWVLHAVALWAWHIPALFEATLDSELIHALQHLSLLASALLFWWAMVAAGPGALGTGAAVLYVFTTSLHTGLLGALLTFAPSLWYQRYWRPGTVWGLTPLEDQQLGGLVMWIPAGLLYTVAGVALMAAWLREPTARPAARGAVGLLLCSALALTPSSAGAEAIALISNERSGTVSIVDLQHQAVVGTIAVGSRPRGIHFAPDGRHAYVALSDPLRQQRPEHEGVAILDVCERRVLRRLPVGIDPEQFAVAPDGRQLYVANEDVGTASIVELPGGRISSAFAVGTEPEGVGVSPDGRWVYVTAETTNTVAVIDTKAVQVAAVFMVDARPRDAVFAPDGRRAYVSAEFGGTVTVVDVAHHSPIARVAMPDGISAVGLRVAPDGRRLYVANGRANSVTIVDTDSLAVTGVVPVGQRPWGLELSPDGSRLYVANGLSNDLTVIDTVTGSALATLPVGDGPWGVAVSAVLGCEPASSGGARGELRPSTGAPAAAARSPAAMLSQSGRVSAARGARAVERAGRGLASHAAPVAGF